MEQALAYDSDQLLNFFIQLLYLPPRLVVTFSTDS